MDQFEIHFSKRYYEFYSGSSLAFEVHQGLVFIQFPEIEMTRF